MDLDQPFKPDDAPQGDTPAGEPDKTETKGKEAEAPTEKPRVPYSRFENVSRARREAEEEAEKWRLKAQELEASKPDQPREEVPSSWLRLYGDTPQTREAYGIWKAEQDRRDAEVEARAERKALEAVQNVQRREQESYRENLDTLDDYLETVSDIAGRELTEDEETKVWNILDEYTAKDEDGKYLGAILPPDKAWELFQLKEQVEKGPTRKSRDAVASVINSPSEGEPSAEQERNKNWLPWRHRDRLPKEE